MIVKTKCPGSGLHVPNVKSNKVVCKHCKQPQNVVKSFVVDHKAVTQLAANKVALV